MPRSEPPGCPLSRFLDPAMLGYLWNLLATPGWIDMLIRAEIDREVGHLSRSPDSGRRSWTFIQHSSSIANSSSDDFEGRFTL